MDEEKTKNLKRMETKPKETKVNGKAEFENGKLAKPKKTAEEQIKALDAKDPKKQAKIDREIAKAETKKVKVEKLADEESPIINLNRCQNADARQELKQIYDELLKLEGVELVNGKVRTSFKFDGRSIARLFPQTDGWSAYAGSNVEKRHWSSIDEYLEKCREVYNELIKNKSSKKVKKGKGKSKSEPKTSKPVKKSRTIKTTSVDQLKERIEKLSNGSKAVHLSVLSPEIDDWIATMGYQVEPSGTGYDVVVRN